MPIQKYKIGINKQNKKVGWERERESVCVYEYFTLTVETLDE
jgi:hypothetical protein